MFISAASLRPDRKKVSALSLAPNTPVTATKELTRMENLTEYANTYKIPKPVTLTLENSSKIFTKERAPISQK